MNTSSAMLLGAAIGGGIVLIIIMVIGWLEEHRIERVELDESWQRFTGTMGNGDKVTHRRIP